LKETYGCKKKTASETVGKGWVFGIPTPKMVFGALGEHAGWFF